MSAGFRGPIGRHVGGLSAPPAVAWRSPFLRHLGGLCVSVAAPAGQRSFFLRHVGGLCVVPGVAPPSPPPDQNSGGYFDYGGDRRRRRLLEEEAERENLEVFEAEREQEQHAQAVAVARHGLAEAEQRYDVLKVQQEEVNASAAGYQDILSQVLAAELLVLRLRAIVEQDDEALLLILLAAM